MKVTEVLYPNGMVSVCMDAILQDMSVYHEKERTLIITDERIFSLHEEKFNGYKLIRIQGGEKNKNQAAVDDIIVQLLDIEIDKTWLIAGVGGGVVTDIAGFAASIYKRGVKAGFIPTTILAMTDAAIGGKNGVNVGMYKNMVGTTCRPQFILYDLTFLDTLPREEWINGFAEIIKHACIKDAEMFAELELHNIDFYIRNRQAAAALIERNAALKNAIVVNDESETGERHLLNFGHTFGHALENLHDLPHGYAISIGMAIASAVSIEKNTLTAEENDRIVKLLKQYELPISVSTDKEKVFELLRKDKKRVGEKMNFVMLDSIGSGVVIPLPISELEILYDQSLQCR